MPDARNVSEYLDSLRELLFSVARDVWLHPQVGFKETYAAERIATVLSEHGFRLVKPVAGIETAFIAEWGEGLPVVGILGEYDALPGLSQKVSATQEPEQAGAPGHACGHNLLGTAGLGAVLAARHFMQSRGMPGTIRYFGCPAEETLMGKVFMAREGAFDAVDAFLTWHPMHVNTLWAASTAALNSFKLSFHGRSAHAASSPESGRSALDAVMLTDVGINYLREHVVPEVRMHGVVTHGGEAPNIVPAYAQSWYYVRAPGRSVVEAVYQRVLNVARGAASMTETSLEVELVAACYEYLPNETLQGVLLAAMKRLGPPQFDEADISFARALQSTLPGDAVADAVRMYGDAHVAPGNPLCTTVEDQAGTLCKGSVQPVSTDVGDVSHIAPTAQFTACCMPLGVPLHSWQAVAACGSSIGLKSMLWASKVLALSTLDVIRNPDVVSAARREHSGAVSGRRYECPIPAEAKPLSS
ncbi:MAG: amidohydrolase [Dehalococcoidia bacterium]|nr:amidohydrolase [Dehalococcoidia bacterium]